MDIVPVWWVCWMRIWTRVDAWRAPHKCGLAVAIALIAIKGKCSADSVLWRWPLEAR
jgi:hypothetical protein